VASEKPKRIYIVFSPDGETPPKVIHDSHKQAHFAAQRMATLNPGRTFHVMQSAGKPAFVNVKTPPHPSHIEGDVNCTCPDCIGF